MKETNKRLEANIQGEVENRVAAIVSERDKAVKHADELNDKLKKNAKQTDKLSK